MPEYLRKFRKRESLSFPTLQLSKKAFVELPSLGILNERKECSMLRFVLLPNLLGRKITLTSFVLLIYSLMKSGLLIKIPLDSTSCRSLNSLEVQKT
jgi:hypothetical protein